MKWAIMHKEYLCLALLALLLLLYLRNIFNAEPFRNTCNRVFLHFGYKNFTSVNYLNNSYTAGTGSM